MCSLFVCYSFLGFIVVMVIPFVQFLFLFIPFHRFLIQFNIFLETNDQQCRYKIHQIPYIREQHIYQKMKLLTG